MCVPLPADTARDRLPPAQHGQPPLVRLANRSDDQPVRVSGAALLFARPAAAWPTRGCALRAFAETARLRPMDSPDPLFVAVAAVDAGGHPVGIRRDHLGSLWLVEEGTSPTWKEHLNALALVWRTVPRSDPRWWIIAGVSGHLPREVCRVRIAVPAANFVFDTTPSDPAWIAALPPDTGDKPSELSFHLKTGEVWDRVFATQAGFQSWVGPSLDTNGWVEYGPIQHGTSERER